MHEMPRTGSTENTQFFTQKKNRYQLLVSIETGSAKLVDINEVFGTEHVKREFFNFF